ncbi:hypothetical protein [Streptomyces sp. NBC_01483]|uniref:hypothetical protein n=1 Tax=Streptomyces sp. NBC_01483 TaxID=2903883 RepID=UPI002E32BB60|nr:hypothetical protein [Streptomyces sp. NBC_01483]
MLELGAMVHQPRQIEKSLVDDAGIDTTLVLDITDRRSPSTVSELRRFIDYMSAMVSWDFAVAHPSGLGGGHGPARLQRCLPRISSVEVPMVTGDRSATDAFPAVGAPVRELHPAAVLRADRVVLLGSTPGTATQRGEAGDFVVAVDEPDVRPAARLAR